MNAPDKTYNFALVLRGVSEPDHRVEDALFEAGCDDATLAVRNGVAYLEFDREAESLEQAILSAVRDVERADCELSVSHVEPDDLVTAAEIARRLGRSRESVRLLASGSRGNGGFPSPLSGVTGKTVLWSWTRVVSWLAAHDRLNNESVATDAETIRDINEMLEARTRPGQRRRREDLLRTLEAS